MSIRLSYLDLMKTSQGEPYSFGGSKFMNASSGEGWSVTLNQSHLMGESNHVRPRGSSFSLLPASSML